LADTVFQKIIAGEIPAFKLYEDDHVLAFLDINPLARGHSLVVPKEPAETLDQLSAEAGAAVGRVLPVLCRAIVKATGTHDYNILQNNGAAAHQEVRHVHFHIIPRAGSSGLRLHWSPGQLDGQDAEQLRDKIAAEVDL
jgi:histidine triad (HIT) family protein